MQFSRKSRLGRVNGEDVRMRSCNTAPTVTTIAKYRKILVPLDGSELAARVLPHVQLLAGCADAEVILFRAYVESSEYGELQHTRESAHAYLKIIADNMSKHVTIQSKFGFRPRITRIYANLICED